MNSPFNANKETAVRVFVNTAASKQAFTSPHLLGGLRAPPRPRARAHVLADGAALPYALDALFIVGTHASPVEFDAALGGMNATVSDVGTSTIPNVIMPRAMYPMHFERCSVWMSQ